MSDSELELLFGPNGYFPLEATTISQVPPRDVSEEDTAPQCKKQRTKEPPSKPKVKAQREKARREKMNRHFSSLAELSNPENPKTDKASILLDALTALKAIKVENDQLKQLNKFLEVWHSISLYLTLFALQEKVSNYEKERSYLFYRQNLMMHPPPDPFLAGHSFITLLSYVQ